MPKVKKAHCYVRDYPGVFRTDGAILFCTFCETNVSCDRKSQIIQHLGTSKHIENSKLKSNKDQVSQQFIKNFEFEYIKSHFVTSCWYSFQNEYYIFYYYFINFAFI